MIRSRVAWLKTLRTLRVPAGDAADASDCECAGDCLLTEAGDDIVIETVAVECITEEAA